MDSKGIHYSTQEFVHQWIEHQPIDLQDLVNKKYCSFQILVRQWKPQTGCQIEEENKDHQVCILFIATI